MAWSGFVSIPEVGYQFARRETSRFRMTAGGLGFEGIIMDEILMAEGSSWPLIQPFICERLVDS